MKTMLYEIYLLVSQRNFFYEIFKSSDDVKFLSPPIMSANKQIAL